MYRIYVGVQTPLRYFILAKCQLVAYRYVMSENSEHISEATAVAPRKSSIFLKNVLTVLWWGVWGVMAVVVCLIIAAFLAVLGAPMMQNTFEDISLAQAIVFSVSALIGVGSLLIVIKQLRQICHTLILGDPFVPENAGRLRIIWITVACAEIFRLVSGVFLSILENIEATTEALEFDIGFRFYIWFLVMALIVIAEIFREGTRLRREQKLTI